MRQNECIYYIQLVKKILITFNERIISCLLRDRLKKVSKDIRVPLSEY